MLELESIAHHLAIVWDRPHVVAIEIDGGVRPRVLRVLEHDIDDGGDDAEIISELAAWAAETFGAVGTLSIVFPRDRVTWRDFEVPNAPDGELPAIVQFQFASQVSGSIERSVIDFLPPSRLDASDTLRVHAAAVPERAVLVSRRLADELGAELTAMSVSSLGLMEVVNRLTVDAATTVGLVAGSTRYTESVVRSGGDIVRSAARRHDGGRGGIAKAVQSEVRRTELTIDDDADGDGTIVLVPGDAAASELDGDSIRYVSADQLPFDAADGVDPFDAAVLAGVGAYFAGGPDPRLAHLDFADPRKPIPPRDRTKDYIRAGIAAAVLLTVGVGWKTWSDVANLDEKIDTARTKISEIDDFLKRQGDNRDVRATLDKYLDSRMPPGEIMGRLLESMPNHDRLIVASLEMNQTTGTNVARVKGRAYAASRADAEQFEAELDRYYQVKPQAKQPSEDRAGYPISLDFEFDVPLKRETVNDDGDEETPAESETAATPMKGGADADA